MLSLVFLNPFQGKLFRAMQVQNAEPGPYQVSGLRYLFHVTLTGECTAIDK